MRYTIQYSADGQSGVTFCQLFDGDLEGALTVARNGMQPDEKILSISHYENGEHIIDASEERNS